MSAVYLHLFVRRLSAYEPGLAAIVRSCVAPRGKWMPAIVCGRPECPTVLRSEHLEFCPRVSEWHVRLEYQLFAVSLVVTAWGTPHPRCDGSARRRDPWHLWSVGLPGVAGGGT